MSSSLTWHTIKCTLRLPNATSYDIWKYRLSGNKTSKRKVFLGKLQLEHILVYFHNPFQLIFELEKKSNLVARAFSAKSYTRDTDSLHSCTRLRLVQEMACLNHSCKIWPRKHSYPNLIPIIQHCMLYTLPQWNVYWRVHKLVSHLSTILQLLSCTACKFFPVWEIFSIWV